MTDLATAAYLGGFTAAEGCFTTSHTTGQHTFRVTLGASDAAMCNLYLDHLGVGTIHHYARRRDHYDDEVHYQVRALEDLREVVVPFMELWLPPSHKRRQFETWRTSLDDYWEHRAKRRRPCTVEGCDEIRRAHGLCRHHLFQQHRM